MLKTHPVIPLQRIVPGVKNDCWKMINQNLLRIAEENKYFRHFFWALQKHPAIQRNIALYGGACRDFLYGFKPKDLDFVYLNSSTRPNQEVLKEALRFAFRNFLPTNQIEFRANRYGSIVLNLDGLIIDLWEIKDTWIFNQKEIETNKSFDDLSYFSPLTSDRILYLFDGSMLISEKFKSTVSDRTLSLQHPKVIDEKYNAMRAMKIAYKYGWDYSSNLSQYIKDRLGIDPEKYNWEKDEFLILNTRKLTSNEYKKADWRKIKEIRQLNSSNSHSVLNKINVMKYLGLVPKRENFILDEIDFVLDKNEELY